MLRESLTLIVVLTSIAGRLAFALYMKSIVEI